MKINYLVYTCWFVAGCAIVCGINDTEKTSSESEYYYVSIQQFDSSDKFPWLNVMSLSVHTTETDVKKLCYDLNAALPSSYRAIYGTHPPLDINFVSKILFELVNDIKER